jgi:hypothetical protein
VVLACVDSSTQVIELTISAPHARDMHAHCFILAHTAAWLALCVITRSVPFHQTALVAGVARMSAAGVPHKNVFGEVFRCVTMQLAAAGSCGVRSDL